MILKRITVGEMESNCYIIGDEKTHNALLIDPGDDKEKIISESKKLKLKLCLIINTHGHIDHIGENHSFNLPIYIHRLDKDCLSSAERNLSSLFSRKYISPKATRLLEDNDEIILDSITLKVIHTPGHTPGSICLKYNNIIFSGDTLFSGGIGRTDLPGASQDDLFNSIKKRLLVFADETVIYPGHGEASTIGKEKRSNPFLI